MIISITQVTMEMTMGVVFADNSVELRSGGLYNMMYVEVAHNHKFFFSYRFGCN